MFDWYWRKRWMPFIMILPIFVLFLLLFILPAIYEFKLSFFRWDLLSLNRPFIGIKNYIDAFQDPIFLKALLNTFLYALIVLPVTLSLALVMALIVDKIRWKELFRTIYFIPMVSSMVVVATVWRVIYQPEYGILNQILSFVGLPQLSWLSSPDTALFSVMIVGVWKFVGFYMVIYLAGLQTIPKVFYEAAKIDGIKPLQSLRYITLPLLRPVIFFTTVFGVIASLQVFSLVLVLSQSSLQQSYGGPAHSTMVYALYLYQQGFRHLNMGYSSALAFVGFFIIAGLTFVQFKYSSKESLY